MFSVASVGAVFAYRKWLQSHIGVVLAAIVSGTDVLTTLVGLNYDLGFRMYYFITILAVLFASVALAVGLQSERLGRWRPLVVGAVVVVFFSYAPISLAVVSGRRDGPTSGRFERRANDVDRLFTGNLGANGVKTRILVCCHLRDC